MNLNNSKKIITSDAGVKLGSEREHLVADLEINTPLVHETLIIEGAVTPYKAFYIYFKNLYGQGLEIANWHQNGDLEPFDEFFESAEMEMNDK